MKKVLSFAVAALLLLFVLTGCTHNDIGVSLNPDGSGSICTTVGFEESFYEGLLEKGLTPFEGKETFDYEYGEDDYIGHTETVAYAFFDEIRQALLDMKYATDYIITGEGEKVYPEEIPIFRDVEIKKESRLFSSEYSFRVTLNVLEKREDLDNNDIFKVSLFAEMPGRITEYKGGELTENKIVYEITDLGAVNEMYVKSVKTNTAAIVIVISLAALVLTAGIYTAIRSKKRG